MITEARVESVDSQETSLSQVSAGTSWWDSPWSNYLLLVASLLLIALGLIFGLSGTN